MACDNIDFHLSLHAAYSFFHNCYAHVTAKGESQLDGVRSHGVDAREVKSSLLG